jgi:hypothetical protein
VLVRILKPSEGILDGIRLGHLQPEFVYDLPESISGFLITLGRAEQVGPDNHAAVVPLDNPRAYEILARGVIVVPADTGATWPDIDRRKLPDRRQTPRGTPDRRQSTARPEP